MNTFTVKMTDHQLEALNRLVTTSVVQMGDLADKCPDINCVHDWLNDADRAMGDAFFAPLMEQG